MRHDFTYKSLTDTSLIHGWIYIPTTATEEVGRKFPTVIMAPGLGAQKDMGLDRYASKFAKEGYAVLIIDYRSFGGSQAIAGTIEHRNNINPWFHIDDIRSLVRQIQLNRFDNRIDKDNLVLWGTSYSGGHVIKLAHDLQKKKRIAGIKGVIAQVPHLDGRKASTAAIVHRGMIGTLRIAILCFFDTVLSFMLDNSPFYVKIVGLKNETAYMILTPDEMKQYYEKHPKKYLGHWENVAPARAFKYMSFYNPIDVAHEVSVPILFIGATDDQLCPIGVIRDTAAKCPHAQVKEIDGGHHDVFNPAKVEVMSGWMIDFLKQVSPVTSA